MITGDEPLFLFHFKYLVICTINENETPTVRDPVEAVVSNETPTTKEELKREVIRMIHEVFDENKYCTPYSGIYTVDYYKVLDGVEKVFGE